MINHYSYFPEIQKRLGFTDIDSGSEDAVHIMLIQKETDGKIDNAIRAHVGITDINGYKIVLPLHGTLNVLDDTLKTVTIAMDAKVQAVANEIVIAQYRRDSSENNERLIDALASLQEYLNERFGHVNDIPLDFFAKTSPGA